MRRRQASALRLAMGAFPLHGVHRYLRVASAGRGYSLLRRSAVPRSGIRARAGKVPLCIRTPIREGLPDNDGTGRSPAHGRLVLDHHDRLLVEQFFGREACLLPRLSGVWFRATECADVAVGAQAQHQGVLGPHQFFELRGAGFVVGAGEVLDEQQDIGECVVDTS